MHLIIGSQAAKACEKSQLFFICFTYRDLFAL